MHHVMNVGDPWFGYIQNGQKTYEGRRWWPKTKVLQPGDFICFQRLGYPETCTKQIKQIYLFPSFVHALNTLDMDQILPGIKTVAEGAQIYRKFVSLETQQKEGICMVELT